MKLHLVLCVVLCAASFLQIAEGYDDERAIAGRGGLFTGLLQTVTNILGGKKIKAACQAKVPGLTLTKLTNNHVYYFQSGTKVSWETARLTCESYGMHLVSLENYGENNLVKTYLIAKGGATDSWIGLTDSAARNTYRWTYKNVLLGAFSDWLYGTATTTTTTTTPAATTTVTTTTSNVTVTTPAATTVTTTTTIDPATLRCVYLKAATTAGDTKWDIAVCTSTKNYICEMPAPCNGFVDTTSG